MASVFVVGKRPCSYREGNSSVRRYIDSKLGVGCHHSTHTSGNEGHLDRIYAINDLIAKGHHKGNVLSESEDYIVPFAAGSIAATPRDLIIFFQALMSGRLLSQGSLQIMFSDMNLMTVTQSTYYGKGIVVALETPVGNIIGHTGGIKGFGASIFLSSG